MCFPGRNLYSFPGSLFQIKKKKKKHQATEFSKCEIISLLFNIGEKKIIPNHVNICSMLLFKSQVTQGLRTWVLALQVIFCIVPHPWKMFFNCTVIQKQDLGVLFFFYINNASVAVSLSPINGNQSVFTEWIKNKCMTQRRGNLYVLETRNFSGSTFTLKVENKRKGRLGKKQIAASLQSCDTHPDQPSQDRQHILIWSIL